jgi:hypothetical protein
VITASPVSSAEHQMGAMTISEPVITLRINAYARPGDAHSSRHSSLRMWLIC